MLHKFGYVKDSIELQQSRPYTETGVKVLGGVKKMHEDKYGTPEQKAARWKKYWEDCKSLVRDDPTQGVTLVRQKVADKYGISLKSVERRTKSLKAYRESMKLFYDR